jgi:hypothetical protein
VSESFVRSKVSDDKMLIASVLAAALTFVASAAADDRSAAEGEKGCGRAFSER